jgi:Skp family chaperone for outer membrane proteins
MRIRHLIPILCVALLATIAFKAKSEPAPSPAAPQTPPTRVGIANPARIFTELYETKAFHEKMEERKKELMAKEKQLREGIDATINDIKNTNPKFVGYDEKLETLDRQNADLQAWGAATKASLDRQQKKMFKQLYDKIEAACAEIAQRDGLDLVIPDGRQDIPSVEQIPAEDLRRILNGRNVLFAAKPIDITEKVIILMDSKFKSGAGGVGLPAR